MEKFNTDLTQVIKWMQNKAPNIQALINSKADWYDKYNKVFWETWEKDVFNLDTASEFGIYVWCEILGVPKENFVFDSLKNAWAYGPQRKNYVYSGMNTSIPAANRETVGGNFFGAGNDIISSLAEARLILKLRYMTLVSDGRIKTINRDLNYAINKGNEWYLPNLDFMYVIDADSTRLVAVNASPDIYIRDRLGFDKLSTTQRRTWQGRTADMRMFQEDALGNWVSETPYKTSQIIENPHIRVALYPLAVKMTALDTDNVGFSFGPKTVNTPPAGSDAITRVANTIHINSVYVKLNGAGDMDIVKIPAFDKTFASSPAVDSVRNWFINQEATFDFSGRGDPVITIKGAVLSDGVCSTDRSCVGFQMLSSGWCRIWNCCISTAENPPKATAHNNGHYYFSSKDGNNKGKTASIFCPMMEKLTYTATERKYPSRPIYKNTGLGAPTYASFTDYGLLAQQDGTLRVTFSLYNIGGINVSSLVDNAQALCGGNWVGYPIQNIDVFATGDGYANVFTLRPPAGYPIPYGPYQGKGMEYRIGVNRNFSPQFINILKNRDLGILPSNAGVPYTVTVIS